MNEASLRDYRLLEARHAPRRAPLVATAAGVAIIAGTHLLVPRMPRPALAILERGFRLDDMGAVLLANDHLAVSFIAFFVGVSGVLGAVVGPREERQLGLLLSKPVPAAAFLAARVWPVFAAAVLAGVVLSLACGLAVAPHAGGGASVTVAGAVGAGLALTAIALVQLALLTPIFVRVADAFHALLIAFVVWFVPLLPTAVFLYRPDLFEGRETLASLTVMTSLIWNDRTLAWLGPLALLAALALAVPSVRLAGALLERTDRT
ncbi:hypothetical protein [Sorangium sp. So ce131]|uniref:hypothetical protein n=1 Tax=Sorangium sp. So ce131 TaxID=3133282 RepID=UPI003F5EC53D